MHQSSAIDFTLELLHKNKSNLIDLYKKSKNY